ARPGADRRRGAEPERVIPLWHFGDPLAPLQAVLARGGVLAVPTESSYGLGVDPRNRAGVEAVYRIKGREGGKALPVVVADRDQRQPERRAAGPRSGGGGGPARRGGCDGGGRWTAAGWGAFDAGGNRRVGSRGSTIREFSCRTAPRMLDGERRMKLHLLVLL